MDEAHVGNVFWGGECTLQVNFFNMIMIKTLKFACTGFFRVSASVLTMQGDAAFLYLRIFE